jgi:23S rRNA pseudouridine2605 synthase
VSIRSQHKQSAVLEMVLDEGKNREIRRMLATLGHKVHQLKRVAVGTLSLGNLLPGQCRQLAWSEIESLRKDAIAAVGPEAERERPRPGGRRPGGPPRRPDGRGRPGGRPPARPARPGQAGKPDRGEARGRPAGRPPAPAKGVGRGGPVPGRRKRAGKASQWRSRPAGGEG